MTDLQTAIVGYQPSTNLQLSSRLVELKSDIEAAAWANVEAVLADYPDMTDLQKRSMFYVDQLKQINGLDLAAVLFRGEVLNIIVQENLHAVHPGQYTTLQEMAAQNGISMSEISQTLDLVNVIFPYLTENYAKPLAQWWEEIGKGKFREMTPVLKSLITGELPGRGSTRESVQRILDEGLEVAEAAGEDTTQVAVQQEVRARVIDELLDLGRTMPNERLRQHIRPERTQPIDATIVTVGEERFIMAQMDEDQLRLLSRQMRGRLNLIPVDLPNDPRQRQIEAARIPELRALVDLVGAR